MYAVVLVQCAANMASRQNRSKVWLYFTQKDDNTVTSNSFHFIKGGNYLQFAETFGHTAIHLQD